MSAGSPPSPFRVFILLPLRLCRPGRPQDFPLTTPSYDAESRFYSIGGRDVFRRLNVQTVFWVAPGVL